VCSLPSAAAALVLEEVCRNPIDSFRSAHFRQRLQRILFSTLIGGPGVGTVRGRRGGGGGGWNTVFLPWDQVQRAPGAGGENYARLQAVANLGIPGFRDMKDFLAILPGGWLTPDSGTISVIPRRQHGWSHVVRHLHPYQRLNCRGPVRHKELLC